MRSKFLVHKTGKAVVIANYHSPDDTYVQISTETVKCGAIVGVCQERFSPFTIRVWLNADPIFGGLLWQQICVSERFCVNLTSWLFHQWKGIKESDVGSKMNKNHYEATKAFFCHRRTCPWLQTTQNREGSFTRNTTDWCGEEIRKDFAECWEADKQARCTHVFNLGKACSLYMQEKKTKNSSEICSVHIHISVQPLTCLCLEPDLNWCKRLLVGLIEYIQLQDVMAWLSTLGGAYSAMGEHFYSYSEKAGQISQHQFLVAVRLGNPILAAQCKVFVALSLIQRGRLKMASRIIREQYHLALNGHAKDEKLISSCKAAWIRIQYIRKQHKIKISGMLTCKDTSTR